MQEIKRKIGNEYSDSKKKERHIVTWTQQVLFISLILLHSPFYFSDSKWLVFWRDGFGDLQEDDTLRDQISIHGTDK
jgi:hypothetical protein